MNRTVRNVILLGSLFTYTLFYRFYLMKKFLIFGESISASFMILFLTLSILFLGFRINKNNMLKKNIFILTIIQIGIFFILYYTLGFFIGFLKNAYSLKLSTMFNNIFAPIIIIICVELFRYIFISANKDSKEMIIISTILLFLFELSLTIKKQDFSDMEILFRVATSSILPILLKNIVFSYLNYYVGYKPALVYRLVMDVYIFVLPIIPDVGDYLNSMIGICMPILLYIFSARVIESYYKLEERVYNKKGIQLIDIPAIIFIVIFTSLISGFFPYYMLGIGSESMSPKLNKGDAVIIHKIKNKKDIEIGDIIVYEDNGKRVIHRLVDIKNKKYYYTKGDANNSIDNVSLKFDDILGVVEMKIPVIAYPSIWLAEKLQKANV